MCLCAPDRLVTRLTETGICARAASQGLRRLGELTGTNLWRRGAAVLVPGDGKTPFAAAACAVSGPPSWNPIISIDPRMVRNGDSRNRRWTHQHCPVLIH
eukprot:SAG22_NODE_890_length_6647_cov_68.631185_7_plen_100_part_00